ncbi:phosphotransferase [Glycomyces sp. TRM65418]|uniref:phosphotransferase enzyme family protein n=1 Tax=Glycomyces sp. TRM65418 TaxID=2867006 RepID=UPI001CE544BF|nr:phosphotransferase [Glycomyces sp. TRM65418]MCC3764448.1 phosphotransferase [Glycomyces sp. TRM65418]QZD54123.1 phosphotransferase [Glycomyces sp. TRM65418]
MTVTAPRLPDAALAHWDLGQVYQMQRVQTGLMNRSWRVDTSSGSYLLKLFRDVTGPELQFQFHVLQTLGASGVPVVLPVLSRDGRTTIFLEGEEFGVFPWVGGRHRSGLSMSRDACRDLGSVIGRLHRTLHTAIPADRAPKPENPPTTEAALQKVDRLLELVAAGRGDKTGFEATAEQTLRLKRGLLVRLGDRRPPDLAPQYTGYTHGDLHPHNVLHGPDDRISAILDWDRLVVSSYAREMARAAVFYFTYGDERGLDCERIRAFAGGYRSVFDVGEPEIGLATHQLWWDRLTDNWVIEWHYVRHNSACDHLLPGQTGLVKWWTIHYSQVEQALMGR